MRLICSYNVGTYSNKTITTNQSVRQEPLEKEGKESEADRKGKEEG
jgi:hypothetical protein